MMIHSAHHPGRSASLAPIIGEQARVTPSPLALPSRVLSCVEAQKCLFVSSLFATLTDSLSRNSFACHSYANTRDGGAVPSEFFSLFQSARETSPALTLFRINTCKSISKQTTLTSIRINTCKKPGGGGWGRIISLRRPLPPIFKYRLSTLRLFWPTPI